MEMLSSLGGAAVIGVLVVVLLMFLLPIAVAFKKKHINRWPIFVLNVAALVWPAAWGVGIAVIIWIAAMVWALMAPSAQVIQGPKGDKGDTGPRGFTGQKGDKGQDAVPMSKGHIGGN